MASTEGIDLTQKLALAQGRIAIDLERILAGRYRLSQIVATLPLALWHTYRTLELAYSDACYSHLNDRYQSKRDQFCDLAKWAYDRVVQLGIGIVTSPVARAATPGLSLVPGFMTPGTYYVTMGWVNAQGEEGAPAVPDAIEVTAGAIAVTPKTAPPAATGWNVYAGPGPEQVVRQNDAPLGLNEGWSPAGELRTDGPGQGWGQSANLTLAVPHVLARG
jgi:hypothetical protein